MEQRDSSALEIMRRELGAHPKLRQLQREAISLLEETVGESAGFEVRQLLTAACGIPGAMLGPCGEWEIPEEEAARFFSWVERRLGGEPLQYILGEWEFYGLPLRVGPGVLIPRPDTETAVEVALEFLQGRDRPVVADLCSGSGAIALALWSQCPGAEVYGVELSPEALPYLRENVSALCQGDRMPVQLIAGDVLRGVELPPLDLLISNPPYLTPQEMEELSPEVEREPSMALLGGADGLLFYREITRRYRDSIKPGGALVFEVGYRQADQVMGILQAAGFCQVGCRKDLGGIRRCVFGFVPGGEGIGR